MGFCYPGSGKSGDLPPRPECAPLWHAQLFERMHGIELVVLVGPYSQRHYLGDAFGENLTETVRAFRSHLPRSMVLPHPSPRNNLWMARNPWFSTVVLPELRSRVARILGN